MFNIVPVFIEIILVTFFAEQPVICKVKKDMSIGLPAIQWLFYLFQGKSLLGQNCHSEGYTHFDFQEGKWEVYRPGTDTFSGKNHVKKTAKGCALLENRPGSSSFRKQCLNTYNASNDSWRQRWVDQSGQVIDFEGNKDDQGMIFRPAAISGKDSLYHRMTYRFNSGTEVTQTRMQKGSGEGKDWSSIFKDQYKKTDK